MQLRQLEIPASLRATLLAYRRRVWCVKLIEAFAGVVIGILAGFLLTFVLDRIFDTPVAIRLIIFIVAMATCGMIPLAIERWILRRRRLDQLARLLSETHPDVGDRLLGILELAEDDSEQARSRELVRAAIEQVSEQVAQEDLTHVVPRPRHRFRLATAGILVAITALLLVFTSAAANNAWARFLTPWGSTSRYTFANVQPLQEQLIVAHGEPFKFQVQLDPDSRWKPETATAFLGQYVQRDAVKKGLGYEFQLPGPITDNQLAIEVGDFASTIRVEPVLRPELNGLRASVRLPAYLGRPESLERDVRGAKLSVVRGSAVAINATASRPLSNVSIDGARMQVNEPSFSTAPQTIVTDLQWTFEWVDEYGLSGQQPLTLSIQAIDDEGPIVVCEGLPRKKILLESELVSFQVRVRDDFGVKRVGYQWQQIDEQTEPWRDPNADGTRLIGAGSPTADSLELTAAFRPSDHQVTPGMIAFRAFAEDYLPGRQPAYGPTCIFQVLDPSQHAIWVNSQLGRWHRMALDVRDREMQLHQANKELRELPAEELSQPETIEKLQTQAQRERANAQQLSGLVRNGEALLQEAMRNEEIAAGQLDRWAEMMQTLKEIADVRMPSVEDLLKQAAANQKQSSSSSENSKAQVGQNRLTQQESAAEQDSSAPTPETPQTPRVTDIESTQEQFDVSKLPKADSSKSNSSPARLGLTETQLAGGAESPAASQSPADEQLDQAVNEQEDLLTEFEKVADDLNEILGDLEGSTLVKRLKAAARRQQRVAAELSVLVPDAFGVSQREKEARSESFSELSETENAASGNVSNLMDDMSAYFQRTQLELVGKVLGNMQEEDVTAALRSLSEDLQRESGLSIAQTEYWSDTLDQWAEDLVEATQAGEAPGAKAKGSLPPAVVLEVLRLLREEVDLRQQTRVAEQARAAVDATEHMMAAHDLSTEQHALQQRMETLVRDLAEQPNAQADFAKEIGLLLQVSNIMQETVEILAKPETGPPAIAAETEIIELLLKSKRFNPNAGGGGGAQPGGGSDGDTETAALALVGAGTNPNEVRQEMSATQSTEISAVTIPDEFRQGLDQYFSEMERLRSE